MIPLLSRLATPAAFTAALLSFHLLFTVLGLGATLILIPARLSRYALIFAPVVGACVVSWLGWQSLWLGFAGTNASSPIICVLCCSLLIVPVVRSRTIAVQALVNREVLLAFGIACCGALALSIPAMAEPNLTTISAGNHDVASYALVERFLMSHAIGDQPGNLHQYLDVPEVAQTVFDALFSSALGGSVLRLESYQLGSVTLGVFALWGAMMFFVIARELFQFRLMNAAFLLAAFGMAEIGEDHRRCFVK